jgi:CubicO group peptidase (beta-lactamase class C family)
MPSRRRSHAGLLGFVLTLHALVFPPARALGQPFSVQTFDAYVRKGMQELEVPGAAVAIVKDGKVVLAKGYGVRRLGESGQVDERTLFAIGSLSKAFTVAALGILVDDGRLHWDDQVVRHLRGFQLYDPYVAREITIRDLLSHRSGLGLGGGDLLWLGSTYTRDEILHRIRYLAPASSFRSRYAYQNVMFLAAGQIVPAVTGKSWDEFVAERLFGPLGMSTATTSVARLSPSGNVAAPHTKVDAALGSIPHTNIDNLAPAGGINASAAELAQWIRMLLGEGEIDGKRILSRDVVREMWTAQTIQPIADPAPPLAGLKPTFAAYGLGWGLRDYRGRKVVIHTGGLPGMVSMLTLVPEERFGAVVLTNQNASLNAAVTWKIVDLFLGAPETDWVRSYRENKRLQDARAAQTERELGIKRAPDTRPSLTLEGFAGRYIDAMYGEAAVTHDGGRLVLRFTKSPAFVADLEPWHYDTFVARWRDRTIPDAFVTFSLDVSGRIDRFTMAAVSPSADFSYDYGDLRFVPVKADPAR